MPEFSSNVSLMTYDEFEAMMLEAGWTLEEIENHWQKWEHPEYSNDTWDAEEWDRD